MLLVPLLALLAALTRSHWPLDLGDQHPLPRRPLRAAVLPAAPALRDAGVLPVVDGPRAVSVLADAQSDGGDSRRLSSRIVRYSRSRGRAFGIAFVGVLAIGIAGFIYFRRIEQTFADRV